MDGARRQPADLGASLEASGLQIWKRDAPGQAAELAALDWEAAKRVPKGYVEERVVDGDGLEAFSNGFAASFGVPGWAGRAWVEATKAAGIDEPPWGMVLGRLNGEPVATTITFSGAGVATVFGLGVVPGAGVRAWERRSRSRASRRRGIAGTGMESCSQRTRACRSTGGSASRTAASASAAGSGDRRRFEPVRAGKHPSAVN